MRALAIMAVLAVGYYAYAHSWSDILSEGQPPSVAGTSTSATNGAFTSWHEIGTPIANPFPQSTKRTSDVEEASDDDDEVQTKKSFRFGDTVALTDASIGCSSLDDLAKVKELLVLM